MNNKEIELFKLRNEYFYLTLELRKYEYFMKYALEDIKDYETEKEKQLKKLKKLKNKFEKTKKESPECEFKIYMQNKKYIITKNSIKAKEKIIPNLKIRIKQWQILKEKVALKLKENQKAAKELEAEIRKRSGHSDD